MRRDDKQRTNRADPSKVVVLARPVPRTTPRSSPDVARRPRSLCSWLCSLCCPSSRRVCACKAAYSLASRRRSRSRPNQALVSLVCACLALSPTPSRPSSPLPWLRPVPKKSRPLPPRLLTMLHPKISPKTAKSRESQSLFLRHFTVRFSPPLPPLCAALPALFSSLLVCPPPLYACHHFFLSPAAFSLFGRTLHVHAFHSFSREQS